MDVNAKLKHVKKVLLKILLNFLILYQQYLWLTMKGFIMWSLILSELKELAFFFFILTYFLAALSSSWSLVVGPSVRPSVRWSTFVKKWSLDYQMRVTEWLSDWVTEWPSDWVTELLSDWLSDWATEWLSDWMTEILWLKFCDWNFVTEIL